MLILVVALEPFKEAFYGCPRREGLPIVVATDLAPPFSFLVLTSSLGHAQLFSTVTPVYLACTCDVKRNWEWSRDEATPPHYTCNNIGIEPHCSLYTTCVCACMCTVPY